MNQSVLTLTVVLIFVGIQILNSRRILIKAQYNIYKMILSIVITVLTILVFWQKNFEYNLLVISISLLLISYGILPEGLAADSLVRFGSIKSSFNDFEVIKVEKLENETLYLSFYAKGYKQRVDKGHSDNSAIYSIYLTRDYSIKEVNNFFESRGYAEKVILVD